MTAPYTAGTISLVSGSPTVVGTDTAWEISLIAGGTIYVQFDGGNPLPIATVDSDTEITAALNWTGPTGTYSYAIMRDTAYGQQTVANAQALATYIQRLNNPALAAAAGVTPSADKILLFTGPNTATVIDLADVSGDVIGPDGGVQNNFPVAFDGVTGKLIKAVAGPLAALHAVAPAANKIPYFTAENSAAVTDLSAFARTVLDDANGTAMYATMGAGQSLAQSGWQRLPSGLIVQWGFATTSGPSVVVTFPMAFPNGVFTITTSVINNDTNVDAHYGTWATSVTSSSFRMNARYVYQGGAVVSSSNISGGYVAIGR